MLILSLNAALLDAFKKSYVDLSVELRLILTIKPYPDPLKKSPEMLTLVRSGQIQV